ncbi:MAG: hypothetical protein NUK65_06045, partial [Firmicutes bacterium]|nr:hypothetical protein [Bacillota bacterium]
MLKHLKEKLTSSGKIDKESSKKAAQEWLPIEDIRDNIMYLRNQRLAIALRVEAVNISLLSENEKRKIIAALHEVINGFQFSMQWLSLGRSVDLDGYIAQLERKAQETSDFTRKKLLKGYIRQAAEMAAGGDTLERRFYILLSQPLEKYTEGELLNRARELAGDLQSVGLKAERCATLNGIGDYYGQWQFPKAMLLQQDTD